jgi:glycosyltransferase involved in cell wall biosynthesis
MAKKPVICSNIGGCAEHVQDRRNGLHFVVGDHFDLLNRVLELAENPELYKRLVKGIPKVLDSQEMFTVLDREYQRILMEPPRRPTGSTISPLRSRYENV